MRVLEERLMYLFILFYKDLLCVPFPFWLKDFHLYGSILVFPPSLTWFVCSCLSFRDLSRFTNLCYPVSAVPSAPTMDLQGQCHCISTMTTVWTRAIFVIIYVPDNWPHQTSVAYVQSVGIHVVSKCFSDAVMCVYLVHLAYYLVFCDLTYPLDRIINNNIWSWP